MPGKLTTQEFIEKAKKIHKDKYNYDKTFYIDAKTKVIITCNEHEDFKQTPDKHLSGRGCKKCGGTQKMTIQEFIEKAEKIHKDKYNYDKVKEYKGNRIPVKIFCPKPGHEEFEQRPDNHLNGSGCPKCGGTQKMTTQEFIEKARNIHKDNKYNYDKVDYKNYRTLVIITCTKNGHGDFKQTPDKHLDYHGCPKCAKTGYSKKCIEFLNTFSFDIKHAENGGEEIIKIKNKNYKLDGYIKALNVNEVDDIINHYKGLLIYKNPKSLEVVIEFHGCFWHGCERCFPNRDNINPVKNKTYSDIYKDTCEKRENIIKERYNYIEIWECQYNSLSLKEKVKVE